MTSVAVVTPVAGRHDHLRRQREALSSGSRRPDVHVLASMADRDLEAAAASWSGTACLPVGLEPGGLPLARARNLGAAHALDRGADVLVFLDVDCIPSATTVEQYLHCCNDSQADEIFSGSVAHLPPPSRGGYRPADLELARPHPGRPSPAGPGARAVMDPRLFWSLSFALTARTWRRIGGFCEDYRGYGAEDTDFAQLAERSGVGLTMVGGAPAYHQHHPTASPPVQHLDAILRNANLFRDRWGWWPMEGWLRDFARMGVARHDLRSDRWVRVTARTGS